jgi:hypothetical protein
MNNWSLRYANDPVRQFWSRHNQHHPNKPGTKQECLEISDLAEDAYQQTRQGPYRGFSTRYKNWANEFPTEEQPQQQPVTQDNSNYKPTPKDKRSIPGWVGVDENGKDIWA